MYLKIVEGGKNEMIKLQYRSLIGIIIVLFFLSPSMYSQENPVSLQSLDLNGYFIGGPMGDMTLFKPQTEEEKEFTTFRIVQGLANPVYVSIQAALSPNSYLRHQHWVVTLNERVGDGLFDKDATFKKVPGLSDPKNAGFASFEAINYPGNFIRYKSNQIVLAPLEASESYKKDATFRIEPPNWNGKNPISVIVQSQPMRPEIKKTLNLVFFILLSLTGIGLIVSSIFKRSKKSES